jgi:hypothetical protein
MEMSAVYLDNNGLKWDVVVFGGTGFGNCSEGGDLPVEESYVLMFTSSDGSRVVGKAPADWTLELEVHFKKSKP